MSGGKNSELNFDLDLLPVISLMSVCIAFLLQTAVWVQIGSLEIKQGLGQEQIREDAKAPSLWISMRDGGQVTLTAMDSPAVPNRLRTKAFAVERNASGWAEILGFAAELKRAQPELKTALIMAAERVNYGDVILVMDKLKTMGIGEVGIAPL